MALSEVMHDVVIKSGKSGEVAEAVGKNSHVLLNELNPINDRHKAGADLLLPIMRTCKTTEPLNYLAEKMGGVYIQLPENNDCEATLVKVVTEFGEFIAAYGKAIEDNKLTPSEKQEIRKEGQEALTAIQGLLCSL